MAWDNGEDEHGHQREGYPLYALESSKEGCGSIMVKLLERGARCSLKTSKEMARVRF
jgi:hypothetical protein